MGENIEETKNKEGTLTFLLENVLEFIIRSYEAAKDTEQFKIVYKLEDNSEAKELKKDNIHEIFNYILKNIRKKNKLHSIWINSDKSGNFSKINFETNTNNLKFIDYVKKTEPVNKKEFSEPIEHSFIDKELKESLKSGLDSFVNKINPLSERNEFPAISDMEKCLKPYYNLLIDLMEGQFVKKGLITKDFLKNLLVVCNTESDKGIKHMSLYSPIVLNNLQKMYRGVIDFYETLFGSLETNPISMEMVYMYRSILIAKVQRIFRWYVYDGEMKYLALLPRPLGKYIFPNVSITVKKMTDCNSFEGIGELRFAEKIIEAYEKFLDSHTNGTLNVALIGDINYPIKFLRKYVEKRKSGIKIQYNIYTKNTDLKESCKYYNNITVDNTIYNEILQSTEKLDKVLNENHVVFLLDCIDLYEEPIVYEEKGMESSMQLFRLNSYNAYSNWADDPRNIFVSNPLDNLYQSTVAYMATGRFGKLEKNPKKQVLEYIESKINSSYKDEFKLVYVYVSDLKAFENIYCREQYYMRVEQYNEKKIGIIRFSTIEEPQLENRSSNMIVLSAWQVVKHIALEDRDKIVKEIKKNAGVSADEIDYSSLHNMYIGLDYSDWKDSIKVYYNYDFPNAVNEEECKKFIKHFIKDIFMQVFQKPKGSIYKQYCKDVIISFLYGDSKSIEDILFVHLLKNDKVNLKNIIWNEEKLDKVKDERNIEYRFSNKRLYDLAMECYDGLTVNVLEEFNISKLFEEEGISKQKYKEGILQACENINYKDSGLYVNCL